MLLRITYTFFLAGGGILFEYPINPTFKNTRGRVLLRYIGLNATTCLSEFFQFGQSYALAHESRQVRRFGRALHGRAVQNLGDDRVRIRGQIAVGHELYLT